MKICLPIVKPEINSEISPVFGRAPYFLVFDLEKEKFKIIKNENSIERGAGIRSAERIADEEVKVVICDNIGPRALDLLELSGIKVIFEINGKAKDIIDKFKKGELA